MEFFFYPIRIRIRVNGRIHKFASALTSFSWIQSSRWALQTNMAYSKVVSSLLIALISSLISCVPINAAVRNLHNQCFKDPSRFFWQIASFCILSWLSAVVQLHQRIIYMLQHTFSWLFQKIWTFFQVINYNLRLFTPCSSYGAEEMTPKSQLCACSFPDTIGYQTIWIRCVWTRKFSYPPKKYLRKKKIPGYVWTGHLLRGWKETWLFQFGNYKRNEAF